MFDARRHISSAVVDLMEVYRTTDFQDSKEVARLQKSFHSLSELLSEAGDRGYWGLSQVGISLCEVLQKSCVLGPQGLTALIESVVTPLTQAAVGDQADPRPTTQEVPSLVMDAARPEHGGVNLNLEDGLRIGQLLITMSLLTAEDVQEALLLQRSKNIRLGDALVELGKVSPEMVSTALEIQRHRRQQAARTTDWKRQNRDVADTSFHQRD